MKTTNRWVIFTLGFVLMLCAGLVFSWSVFVEPIENDLGFLRQNTSLVFPISLSVSIAGQMLAGFLVQKKHYRANFLLSALLFGVGFSLPRAYKA
ncbi:MAG: hypothetical protein ACK5JF_00485 [Oscillospiraceae bacterium]